MSRVEIMGLKWYVLGVGKSGVLMIDGPFGDMDSADESGLKVHGTTDTPTGPHRNFLILAEWSYDTTIIADKVTSILSKQTNKRSANKK